MHEGACACVHALLEGVKAEDQERGGCRYANVRSASGFTPLHFAVASNCVPATRALLSFDACIDDFNTFDAGEFWISCATKTTPLHVAAISNRLHCAASILQYYATNKQRLCLDDPRTCCDKKGRTPMAIAQQRGYTELAEALQPGSDIQLTGHLLLGGTQGVVMKLQVVAAKVVQTQLLGSIQEAEEFMKLLGTYQQHGRVFARLAYDSEQPNSKSTSSLQDMDFSGSRQLADSLREAAGGNHQSPWSNVLALGGSMSNALANTPGGAPPDRTPTSKDFNQTSYGNGTASHAKRSHDPKSNGGKLGELDPQQAALARRQPQAPKGSRQAAIKQWLSYEMKAVAAGTRPARRAALQERSMLSQINPDDAEQHCAAGCLALLRIGTKAVFVPPQPGEDVCGLCHDNKPLLQMQPCGHRTCLLCAKSLCYLLDLQQLVLCPFCGSLVMSFGLA